MILLMLLGLPTYEGARKADNKPNEGENEDRIGLDHFHCIQDFPISHTFDLTHEL